MPYYLKVRERFDAAHHIPGYDGKCARLHGHTYGVECVLKYHHLDSLGMGADFVDIKKALGQILETVDHRNLNEVLGENATTAESVSKFVFSEMEKLGMPIYEVTVQEGQGGACTFRQQ